MSLLDDIGAQVSSTWSDVTSTGVPAAIAGVENYAASQLTQQATVSTQAATAAASQIAAQPGPSSGIMKSISAAFTSVGQNVVVKQYGVYILGGAALLIVGGFYLRGKK